jgi:hypothetical protein
MLGWWRFVFVVVIGTALNYVLVLVELRIKQGW